MSQSSVDLDLRRLRYVIAVADELHFGRAAERLHIAQPALSQQVRTFEAALGAPVFERTTRAVSLTPAGERLIERGRRILAEADAAVAEVRRIAGGEEGTLRLGFIGSATYGLMPSVVRAMRERHPLVTVELTSERLSTALALGLHAGELDAAVMRPCRDLTGLEHRTLGQERLVAALPAHHPLAGREAIDLADLADDGFVSFPLEDSAMGRAQHEACLVAGFVPAVAAQVAETSALVTFVAAGIGVALVPAGVEQVKIPGVAYRPLSGEPQHIPLLLAWHPDSADHLLRRAIAVISALT